jgi:hypothetical protein
MPCLDVSKYVKRCVKHGLSENGDSKIQQFSSFLHAERPLALGYPNFEMYPWRSSTPMCQGQNMIYDDIWVMIIQALFKESS